jgi:arylsulfatase A-like enzyme
MNEDLRPRAGDVKSVDVLIGSVIEALRTTGRVENTCIVFSADNGLDMGEQWRTAPGDLASSCRRSAPRTAKPVPVTKTAPLKVTKIP